MNAPFPLSFVNEEASLLTAVLLGFLFGFTLERAGFGNARKLAAQFYLHDMTVFKVMFTAILVAMVGLFGCGALGWVDIGRLWINPTFLYSQLVGGFLLGVGFILSGLCPGTAVVSAASGRIDALVAFAGVFLGTLLFAVAVDVFPWIERLYHAGSFGTSLLPELFGVPSALLALFVVLGAGAAFIGAEKVERIFAARRPALELAPTVRPRLKLAVPGVLAVLALGATLAPSQRAVPVRPGAAAIPAATVAERIIAREPLLLLDVRTPAGQAVIPGAQGAALDSTAVPLLDGATGLLVVLYDEKGELDTLPATWPADLQYAVIRGGFAAWQAEVLEPAAPASATLEERARVERHNQVAAFFSGAKVAASAAAPPPVARAGGGAKKKKSGGC